MSIKIQAIQDSFQGGLDMFNDRAKLGNQGKYPLLINARSRFNNVCAIKKPQLISAGLPSSETGNYTYQGLYSAGSILVCFASGNAYIRNLNSSDETFYRLPLFQMSPVADTIYMQLVPASTINYQRRALDNDIPSDGIELFNNLAFPSPVAAVCQEGISQPWIILSDGSSRVTKNYSQWTNDANGREYLPIGKQMVFAGAKLYISDGKQIFQSVSGRPLDFMVVIDDAGNKLELESEGGAKNVSHRVFYDDITCLGRLSTDGEDGYYVSSPGNSFVVTPDFSETVYGEPKRFRNKYISNTGAINQFAFLGDVGGDSVFINLNGIISFNGVLQFRNASKNSPFSLAVSRLFNKNIFQTVSCAGQFDNYSCYAVKTTYGTAVLWFDELRNVWDAIDLWSAEEVNGDIRMFTEVITTAGERKLFFLTTTGYVYEYFGSAETAGAKLYVGDWNSGDPNVELKLGLVKCLFDQPENAGTISATLFVDNKQDLALVKAIPALYIPSDSELEIPFGDSAKDSLVNLNFDFGRTLSGYKVGVLLEWNVTGNLMSVAGGRVESLEHVNTPQQSAIDMSTSKAFLKSRALAI